MKLSDYYNKEAHTQQLALYGWLNMVNQELMWNTSLKNLVHACSEFFEINQNKSLLAAENIYYSQLVLAKTFFACMYRSFMLCVIGEVWKSSFIGINFDFSP